MQLRNVCFYMKPLNQKAQSCPHLPLIIFLTGTCYELKLHFERILITNFNCGIKDKLF